MSKRTINESLNDQISRLRAMVNDDGNTWDLSPNDKNAIQTAVKVMSLLQYTPGDADLEGGLNRDTGDHELWYGDMHVDGGTMLECFIKVADLVEQKQKETQTP